MPTSLVTGGAGFIGSHIADHLVSQGHIVIIIDDLSGGQIDNIPLEVIFIQGSILDLKLLDETFEKYHIDYIYHLAAYAAEGLSHFVKRFNYQNNLVGSVNLINEAVKHEVKCFVFTSSIAVYGNQLPPLSEEYIPQPQDPYGIAKYAVEQELKVTKEIFGLDYVIFRPHNVYGERQNIADPYRNVVGIFMNQLMKGEHLSIFGDGNQTRAFSYVRDIAGVIADSTSRSEWFGESFNIGSDDVVSVKNLAKLVMGAMELECPIDHHEERMEVQHAFASHDKLNRYVDLPHTPLEVGLQKMADWAKMRQPKPSKKFNDLELTKNLPPFWK